MEALLILLGILVCFNFVLKQTFLRLFAALGVILMLGIVVYLLWPSAILQSKTQIAQWARTPAIMLNISVLVTFDIVVQLFFCMRWARRHFPGARLPRVRYILKGLEAYPGIMVLPTAFAGLTWSVFAFPGHGFRFIAGVYSLALVALFSLSLLLFRSIRVDEDTRLELLFLTSVVEALLGIVVTVNGATAVQAVSSVNWIASLGVLGIILAVALLGLAVRRVVKSKNRFII